nr:hypothetical protein Iba_scaffold13360CG0010 [Ipomoea batatas]
MPQRFDACMPHRMNHLSNMMHDATGYKIFQQAYQGLQLVFYYSLTAFPTYCCELLSAYNASPATVSSPETTSRTIQTLLHDSFLSPSSSRRRRQRSFFGGDGWTTEDGALF